jgi:UDP-N-acetylmuramate dehydrogenase
MEIKKNVLLAPFTSWQIGGSADHFCLPKNLDELKEAVGTAEKNNWAITVLGGGSNVLVSDDGVEGLVIGLKDFAGTKIDSTSDEFKIEAWSGTSKSELLKIYLKHKLAPALFLAGLPGDVGGGVVMNAGVSEQMVPREFGEIVEWVEVLRPKTLKVERLESSQIKWSYRHSDGWQPGIVVRVGLKWPLTPEADILDKVKNANRVRLSKQPLDQPSCGSVFVNPAGHKAAQLIEQSGLKGYRVGDAQVSTKHANFIVNLGKAKAQDVRNVIEHVKKTVLEKKSVSLKTEVILLGRW